MFVIEKISILEREKICKKFSDVNYRSMESNFYRLQVWFEGHVQGVGFRYKTKSVAEGYDVNGYVENLDDGRVHLVAVGEISEVREFVEKLEETMSGFIRTKDEREDFVEKPYKGFSIRL